MLLLEAHSLGPQTRGLTSSPSSLGCTPFVSLRPSPNQALNSSSSPSFPLPWCLSLLFLCKPLPTKALNHSLLVPQFPQLLMAFTVSHHLASPFRPHSLMFLTIPHPKPKGQHTFSLLVFQSPHSLPPHNPCQHLLTVYFLWWTHFPPNHALPA